MPPNSRYHVRAQLKTGSKWLTIYRTDSLHAARAYLRTQLTNPNLTGLEILDTYTGKIV